MPPSIRIHLRCRISLGHNSLRAVAGPGGIDQGRTRRDRGSREIELHAHAHAHGCIHARAERGTLPPPAPIVGVECSAGRESCLTVLRCRCWGPPASACEAMKTRHRFHMDRSPKTSPYRDWTLALQTSTVLACTWTYSGRHRPSFFSFHESLQRPNCIMELA